MKIVMHEKPLQRASWAPHGVEGFYLGPALEHYRCFRGWVVKTQHERVVDTVAWHPHNVIMPGSSENELLIKALSDLRAAIHTRADHLPPTDTQSLTALHQELSDLFPAPPPQKLSPLQQLMPKLRTVTQQLQLSPSTKNGTPAAAAEQRVDRSPHPTANEQRVPHHTGADQSSCPTIVPFSTVPPPGRMALPPGGDNVPYSHSNPSPSTLLPVTTQVPSSTRITSPMPANDPTHPVTAFSARTHVGKWQVKRVVNHRGKVTQRTKLLFRIQWHPKDGTTSPDTWIPWNQARWLDATALYIKTIPLLHYLVPLMPQPTDRTVTSAEHPVPPHAANSTTGNDGKPLRYNRLMKGSDAESACRGI